MNLPNSLLKLLAPRMLRATTSSGELTREITMEEASPAMKSTRSHLLALPPELQLEIFKHLHRVSSTCLGLTCKEFYPIHKQLHGVVKLQEVIVFYRSRSARWGWPTELGKLLNLWAGPKFYYRSWEDVRFTKMPNAEKESRKESGDGGEK